VHTEVRRYDLRTHRVVATVTLTDDQTGGFSYDWLTDRFLVSDSSTVWRSDALGRHRTACAADQSQVVSTLSGLVASGDGEVYEQLEDDQTLLHAVAGCRTGAAPAPPRSPVRHATRRLGSVPGPPGSPGAPPGPPPAAGSVAAHAPAPQPAPDPASAGVPVANALPAGVPVPQRQEQGEPAYAMADANAANRASMVPVAQLLGAALASAVALAVAARRRTAPAYARR
jgi:hypothetical protein